MLLSFNVYTKVLKELDFKKISIISTINAHSYYISKKDIVFKKALQDSDILLPDGIGIVWANYILNKKKIKKIAGYDIFTHLIQKLNNKGGKCFFLGSSEYTLKLIKKKVNKEFPNVIVNTFSPAFKDKFSENDNFVMRKEINNFKPNILFVGMTAPKQEKWVYQNKEKINAGIICSIGAVFDFYAETVKRPHKIWVMLGLEWLIRLIRNPKRMWSRTFISTPIFIKDVLIYKIKGFFPI